MEVTRANAWATLTRYTTSQALLRHALAVEAGVRAYARRYSEDEELWGAVALLHDFDYEMHPTLDEHPQEGAPILRGEGWPEEVVEAVLSHAEHLGLPRDTALKRTLFACDELSGFIHACGLVRPDGIDTLEPKVGTQEAEAAVVRRWRPPRGGAPGRRAPRRRPRRAHRLPDRGHAPDRQGAWPPHVCGRLRCDVARDSFTLAPAFRHERSHTRRAPSATLEAGGGVGWPHAGQDGNGAC